MRVAPDLAAFSELFDRRAPQVVWTRLVADLETPVSCMMKLAGMQSGDGVPNSFLLESVEGGATRGRYSIIGVRPDLIWRCRGDAAEINRQVPTDPAAYEPCDGDVVTSLADLIAESRIDLPPDLPPMASGLIGYMAYDMVRHVERIPDANPDVLDIPDAMFMRPTVVAIFDNVEDTITIVTPVWPPSLAEAGGTGDATAAYAAANERLASAVDDLRGTLAADADPAPTPLAIDPASNMSADRFKDMVERAKEYIRAGDIFQVVPSQRFSFPFPLPPFALYRSLRRLNPSPFLFFLDFGAFTIVGSSPEILVRTRDGVVTIRPLAGTRPRGTDRHADEQFAAELLADPKERAEHLMLLDLGRNDVGRVAEIGSVKVTEQFQVERYSHVMHIVSNVEGALSPDYDALRALLAGFPAGTVSGAPKVRAMEIIDELEPERRGIYAGAVGYFGADGDMDTCIALRTALIKDGTMYVQAGVGVVADSDPDAEFEESVNKAKALIRAAADASRFAAD